MSGYYFCSGVAKGCVKKMLTWRKFPNKQENEIFWESLKRKAWNEGRTLAEQQAVRHSQIPKMSSGAWNCIKSYEELCAVQRACLHWTEGRLRKADYDWLWRNSGRYDEELWNSFWFGYNTAVIEMSDSVRFPKRGELVKDFHEDQMLVCLSDNVDPYKWELDDLEINFVDFEGNNREININQWIFNNHCSSLFKIVSTL
jgi:hypothetical protein